MRTLPRAARPGARFRPYRDTAGALREFVQDEDTGEAGRDLIDEFEELHGGALPFADPGSNARRTPETGAGPA
ncbi:hypothetical protein [Streptomyces sp. NPDC014656]|uniref:hypothetical protein n=1 Tax=Streptomyces sp. NPDC014656 TaxID=3364878 RepID=UPI0036F8E2DF